MPPANSRKQSKPSKTKSKHEKKVKQNSSPPSKNSPTRYANAPPRPQNHERNSGINAGLIYLERLHTHRSLRQRAELAQSTPRPQHRRLRIPQKNIMPSPRKHRR